MDRPWLDLGRKGIPAVEDTEDAAGADGRRDRRPMTTCEVRGNSSTIARDARSPVSVDRTRRCHRLRRRRTPDQFVWRRDRCRSRDAASPRARGSAASDARISNRRRCDRRSHRCRAGMGSPLRCCGRGSDWHLGRSDGMRTCDGVDVRRHGRATPAGRIPSCPIRIMRTLAGATQSAWILALKVVAVVLGCAVSFALTIFMPGLHVLRGRPSHGARLPVRHAHPRRRSLRAVDEHHRFGGGGQPGHRVGAVPLSGHLTIRLAPRPGATPLLVLARSAFGSRVLLQCPAGASGATVRGAAPSLQVGSGAQPAAGERQRPDGDGWVWAAALAISEGRQSRCRRDAAVAPRSPESHLVGQGASAGSVGEFAIRLVRDCTCRRALPKPWATSSSDRRGDQGGEGTNENDSDGEAEDAVLPVGLSCSHLVGVKEQWR